MGHGGLPIVNERTSQWPNRLPKYARWHAAIPKPRSVSLPASCPATTPQRPPGYRRPTPFSTAAGVRSRKLSKPQMPALSSSFTKSSGSLSILRIPTAKAFEPLLGPVRYKGLYGGRGSGKSHFFGELMVETCQAEHGTLAVCIREAQRTLAQSSKRLIESK